MVAWSSLRQASDIGPWITINSDQLQIACLLAPRGFISAIPRGLIFDNQVHLLTGNAISLGTSLLSIIIWAIPLKVVQGLYPGFAASASVSPDAPLWLAAWPGLVAYLSSDPRCQPRFLRPSLLRKISSLETPTYSIWATCLIVTDTYNNGSRSGVSLKAWRSTPYTNGDLLSDHHSHNTDQAQAWLGT